MDTTRTIAKNTLFNFIATASDVFINLVVGIALARQLGTEDYGLYSLLMWFLGLAVLVVNLGLGEMSKRYIAESQGQQNVTQLRGVIRLSLLVRASAAVVVSLVIVIFSGYWAGMFGGESSRFFFTLLALALLPNVLNYALTGIFARFQKYEYGAYLMLGTNPLRAVAVIVLLLLGFGIQQVLIVNIGVWVLGLFIGFFLLHRLTPLKSVLSDAHLDSTVRKRALKYAITVAGTFSLNYVVWRHAEVLFLGLYRPVEEVGYYTLASKLPGSLMQLIPYVLGAVLLPAVSEQFGRGDMKRLRGIYVTAARYLMMLAFPLAAAGIALARPLILLLYGAEYTPVILLMQIIFIPFAMRGISQAATSVIYGTNEPAFILKVVLLLAFLNLGLNLWLVPRYGVLGAAIGSSVPRLLTLPLYIRFASRKIGSAWPMGDTVRIGLASVIMGAVLFVLQNYLGVVLSLALSVPLGLIVFTAVILTLGVVRQRDVDTLNGIQKSLPQPLRKSYTAVIRLLERAAGTKSIATKEV